MRSVAAWCALVSGVMVVACSSVVVEQRGSSKSGTGSGGGGSTSTSSTTTTFTYPGPSATVGGVGGSLAAGTGSSSAIGVGGAPSTIGVGATFADGGGWGSAVAVTNVVSAVSSNVTVGAGGGGLCGHETNDALTIALVTSSGTTIGCHSNAPHPTGSASTEIHVRGAVKQTSPNIYSIDTCPPNADCIALTATLSLSGPGVPLVGIPDGTFVDVHLMESPTGLDGCADTIVVNNLPTWGSVPNPVFPTDRLWFAGSDGLATTLSDAPFSVTAVGLGCFPQDPNCGTPHDDYELQLTAPGSTILVPMGGTTYWSIQVGLQIEVVAVTNLRSFASGLCDDPGSWDYAMALVTPL